MERPVENQAKQQKTKLKLLYLLQILQQETDEEHPLPAAELCERMESFGIQCERKSIYRDIGALNEFGYEILSARTPRQGFFLTKRKEELQPTEVRLLLDAVATAPFVTEKKTNELTEKLCGFLSRHQADAVKEQIWIHGESDRVKLDNEEVYYTIDAIHRAIEAGNQIRFTYYHKIISGNRVKTDGGRQFTISPYAMIWNEDKYYLVGNYDKYDDLSHYRIDRMKRVEILEKPVRPLAEVSSYQEQFDIADYLRSTYYMYGGAEQQVRLSCEDGLLESMVDKFGQLRILEQQDGRFVFETKVRYGEGFCNWILRWGGRVVVLEPENIRDEIAKKIRTLADSYGIEVS